MGKIKDVYEYIIDGDGLNEWLPRGNPRTPRSIANRAFPDVLGRGRLDRHKGFKRPHHRI